MGSGVALGRSGQGTHRADYGPGIRTHSANRCMHDQVFISFPFAAMLSFMFIFILILISHECRRSRTCCCRWHPFGKEKSAVSIVLELFGNMHSGVQERPKKQGHVLYRVRDKGGKIPFSAWQLLYFLPPFFVYTFSLFPPPSRSSSFYFPDTNGVLQRVAVTASHLQVNEASVREGRDLASLL